MCQVVIIGTLDTKGQEFKLLQECIEKTNVKTFVVDTGVKGTPLFEADISRQEVAKAGGSTIEKLIKKNDRGQAIDVMMKGAAKVVKDLYKNSKVGGVVSLGGTAGTTIGTYVMRSLPIGLPKLQVSTVASGNTRPYVGAKDITMMYSVVDIAGINSISHKIISNAANAIAGMALNSVEFQGKKKPLIAATMFGVTTPCVNMAREYLEEKGYELLVFHATGTGGQSMEALVNAGYIKGVLDITTTELADELVGGVFSAGENRLKEAASKGIPQVVSVGALDMVNFDAMDTVPDKFKNRNLYKHNASVTLMRTNKEENSQLGQILSKKLNQSKGQVALYIPLKGVSMIDGEGNPFYGKEENQALFDNIRKNLDRNKVELIEMDNEINDREFALAMAKKLHSMILKEK